MRRDGGREGPDSGAAGEPSTGACLPSHSAGPGASSLTGAFHELGRYVTDETTGRLHANPAPWTRDFGVLFIEQPIGVGFSGAGTRRRPASSAAAAVDLVSALHAFFAARPDLAARPLILAGESYAGRYLPEAADLALRLQDGPVAGGPVDAALPTGPLSFRVRGVAIGNGLVDPESQASMIAPYLHERGLINDTTLAVAAEYNRNLSAAIQEKRWSDAHAFREGVVDYLTTAALPPNGTLLDVRRTTGYDAGNTVRRLLRRNSSRAALGVDAASPSWVRKATDVARALHDDKAVSAAPLVADLLARKLPVLLYFGVEDAKDGSYSAAPWISRLSWPGRAAYDADVTEKLPPQPDGDPGGAVKSGGGLSVAEIYGAGHMAPRDQPQVTRALLGWWVDEEVLGLTGPGVGGNAAAAG